MRWSISASPAKPASSAARATSVSQASGSSPHGKRDTCRTDRRPRLEVRSALGRGAAAGIDGAAISSAATSTTRSHPSASSRGRTSRTERSCAGEHRCRDRPVAGGVAAAALGVRGVEHDGDRRQPALAGRVEPGAPLRRVEPEGVDHRGQATTEPCGDDGLEDGERVGRGVEVVRPAAHDAAQGVGGDDLLGAVVGRGPGRLPGPRGADEHHEGRVGESHAPSLAYLRGPSSPARRAARRRRRTPRRRRT